MKKLNIKDDFIRGWFIGDFEPSVLRTKDFEVAVMFHKKGEKLAPHYHKLAIEYNIMLEGKMKICGEVLTTDDVFIIYPNEIADPIFYEDCKILCVKVPSIIGDKYEIHQNSQ